MKQYIAIVGVDGAKVTKYQDFDTQVEADAHVLAHGGFVVAGLTNATEYWVVSGTNVTEDTAQQTTDQEQSVILAEINRLETQETPRRVAEAILDPSSGRTWLTNNRAAIAVERAKL